MEHVKCNICRQNEPRVEIVTRKNSTKYCDKCYTEKCSYNERRKRKMVRGLIGFVAGVGLTFGGVLAGKTLYNHYTSDEYKRNAKLNEDAAFVLEQKWDRRRNGSGYGSERYTLNDGKKIEVENRTNSLSFIVDDSVVLLSEDFIYPDDDARNLRRIYIKLDNEVWSDITERVDRETWQRKYEKILTEVARRKREYIDFLNRKAEKIIFGEENK